MGKVCGIRCGTFSHHIVVNAFSSRNTRTRTPSICKSASILRRRINLPLCKIQRLSFHNYPSLASIIPYTRGILLSAIEDDEEETDDTDVIEVDRRWNIIGLRKEVSRLTVRCHKKVGKANQRLQNVQKELDRLTGSEDVTMEELANCPNVDEFETQVEELRNRLTQLNELEIFLQDIKGKKMVLPDHIATIAILLEVQDETPQRPERGPKKQKGPRQNMVASRLPYRRYYTSNKTEIRVGKQAEDNDELSTSPEHRDGSNWWLHASGCPGSHIVIRCNDQNLDEAVVMDAAALAARQSKCNGNIIKVSMTRARDVLKPPGAKAGLVQLTGKVRTVVVNMKEAQTRLDRMDKTVLIN